MPAASVQEFGQSLWLDAMERRLLTSGELETMIALDGIRGVTSNPSIFEKAMGHARDYDEQLRALLHERDRSPLELYEELAITDIRGAADVLRPVYDASNRADGYACLEVSPRVAHDTRATVEEARRLWRRLARPNVMIKVPATSEGIVAISQLLSEGINVNVTLMFGLDTYERVANAYLVGARNYASRGGDLRALASVASIFVSRFDVMIDPMLERAAEAVAPANRQNLLELHGQIGIANAKRTYQAFRAICKSERFAQLAQHGARPQRILFASTSTKDKTRSDVAYVEALIGPDTIDTVPTETLRAFRDHGRARESVTEGVREAEQALTRLEPLGISLRVVTDRLLKEGLDKFGDAFDKLLHALDARRRELQDTLVGPRPA